MRRFTGMMVLALAGLGVLLLAGCSASPEGVAEEFATRFAEKEFKDLDKYLVPEQREVFKREMDELAKELAAPDEATSKIIAAMEVDVRSVDGELIKETAEAARVRLTFDVEVEGPGSDAFLISDSMGMTLNMVRAEGTLDFMLAKVKGQWRIDLDETVDLWEDGFATW